MTEQIWNAEVRNTILTNLSNIVLEKFYDPAAGRSFESVVRERRERIVAQNDPDEFARQVEDALYELGSKHAGFYHRSARRVPARRAINATFDSIESNGRSYWAFQDVHEGGATHASGIRPGDLLIAVNQREVRPPVEPMLPMESSIHLTVQKPDGRQLIVKVDIPQPGARGLPPQAVPKLVSWSRLQDGIGYLKVSSFPGIIGIEVARETDQAISGLNDCRRLIIDLRGNHGGGIGGLRLMSYMAPDKHPVGYSLMREREHRGYRREELPQIRQIPSSKLGLLWLALKFKFFVRERSIVVVTEGLGPRAFHDRVVILANRHTAGFAEIACGFAAEHRLAKIVGSSTAGMVLPGASFSVGHDYLARLPVGQYLTWKGQSWEKRGVSPDVEEPFSVAAAQAGVDRQLDRAVEVVSSL